ncbi:cytochrome c oxidase subunit II [Sphingomonas sp. 3-13AW]|uniref:cytochrome c oxidase subunit II n=1 Tax=Sphingomonas sp. 3-13AW TaxID=3050450 RepID=UPI003BB7C3DB
MAGMGLSGLKLALLGAGLAIAGVGHAAAPATPPNVGTQAAAPQVGAPPPGSAEAKPDGTVTPPATAGAAQPDAAAADPTLNADGTPRLLPAENQGQPSPRVIGLQEQVTPNGQEAARFHNHLLMPVLTAIVLLVLALLIWVVIRYRAAAHPNPSRTSHNTMIEILWTAVPVLILAVFAVPSIRLLAHQYKPAPENAVTLKAIGNQWFWTYEYPDNGGVSVTANMLKERDQVAPGQRYRTDADGPRLLATDNRIVLPVGVPIRLITTANDVIHSWAIPSFWIKLDAIPGRLNETSFTIEKPGVYFGQCSELCGARHAYMPIAIDAVPPAEFAAWIRAKGGTMPGEAQPSAAAPAQPSSDAADDTSTPAAGGDGPTVNATAAATPITQGATGNPAGAGNADQ